MKAISDPLPGHESTSHYSTFAEGRAPPSCPKSVASCRRALGQHGQHQYSNGNFIMHLDPTQGLRLTDCAFGVYPRQTEMKIKVAEVDDSRPPERMKDFKGRVRTWPGLLLTMVIVGGALAAIVMAALDQDRKIKIGVERYEQRMQKDRNIDDSLEDNQVLISDDGQVGNPKSYPDMGCELPDYQSKHGQIFAVSMNGTEVPVGIKGINWIGMETGLAAPFGLWENMYSGTSVYEIAGPQQFQQRPSSGLYQKHPQEHGPTPTRTAPSTSRPTFLRSKRSWTRSGIAISRS